MLQAIQTSFDGDLLRFDTDIRALKKSMSSSPSPSSPSSSMPHQPIPHLLASLIDHSHMMAQLLTSLTKHFDLCVTAVRATDGGADLARRRAAESQGSGTGGPGDSTADLDLPGVSISGVIAEQESHLSHLDPLTSEDRADMVRVVVEDAAEVDDVVREIIERLSAMEADAARLDEQAARVRAAHAGTLAAFRALEDLGARVTGYAAAEVEFLQRWEDEKDVVYSLVREMEGLHDFYEKYSGAYGSLILEVERRRGIEERIQAIWRKARDGVDRLVEADRREREVFRQDAGEYLPTDLWHGISAPLRRWEVVQAREDEAGDE
jgi:autophagy-related protein 17